MLEEVAEVAAAEELLEEIAEVEAVEELLEEAAEIEAVEELLEEAAEIQAAGELTAERTVFETAEVLSEIEDEALEPVVFGETADLTEGLPITDELIEEIAEEAAGRRWPGGAARLRLDDAGPGPRAPAGTRPRRMCRSCSPTSRAATTGRPS